MKKLMALLLAFVLLASLISCQTTPPEVPGTTDQVGGTETEAPATDPETNEGDGPVDPYTTYTLNSSTPGVKLLGVRNLQSDSYINCDWSCSGMELNIDCKEEGDITVRVSTENNRPANFRIYLDGAEWLKPDKTAYYKIGGTDNIIMRNVPAGKHTLSVVKVNDYAMAQARFISIKLNGSIEQTAPADKALYIEFVGDGITGGIGNTGAGKTAYTDQDGTLAYPYLMAKALDADYAITALSNVGLLTGAYDFANAYLYDSPSKDFQTQASFERKADLVVINLGTVDFALRNDPEAGKGISESAFAEKYEALLRTVMEKNGENCKILCVYNCVNDTYAGSLLSACNAVGGASAGVYSIALDRITTEYPTAENHQAYATALKRFAEKLLPRENSSVTVTENGDGDTDSIQLQ